MADVVKEKFLEAVHFLFPKNCFEELILNFNVFHRECAPLVASRGLGLAITAGSILLFVPQILKIAKANSAEGISLISMILGLIPALGTVAYSYEKKFIFSQYGDSVFVSIQMAIIIMQIIYYSDYSSFAFAFLAAFWALSCAIFYHYIPFSVIYGVQTVGILFLVVSKGIQIFTNFKNKSTGQLALATVVLQFGGCLARIFTTMTETDDKLVLLQYIIATTLNGLIFAQFFIYWDSQSRSKKKKQ